VGLYKELLAIGCGTGTCRIEPLDRVVVDLQRRVGLDASEANHMVAVVVELDKRISDDVVSQTDVVHDEHAAVHLPANTNLHCLIPLTSNFSLLAGINSGFI